MSRPRSPLRDLIEAELLADRSPKEIAGRIGASNAAVCKWIANTAFRRIYVTPEERALILSRRRGLHLHHAA